MNFTREPIIETVITPREGCKLVVRSSKGATQEDYFVDAVEVVSFGHSFFFRSQERPKSFLVPVSDYEILELKETRMVLKNVSTEKSIKISGGRESPPRPREETPVDPMLTESRPAPERVPSQDGGRQLDRKRDRRRRGRRGRDRHESEMREPPRSEMRGEETSSSEELQSDEPLADFSKRDEEIPEKAPSFISKLFPPPTTLISENLSRYKPVDAEERSPDESIFQDPTPVDPDLEDENEE